MAHEINMERLGESSSRKKHSNALKAAEDTLSEKSDGAESAEGSEDEEAFLSRRLQHILAKKKYHSGRRYFKKGKDLKKPGVMDSKKSEPICYECKKPGRIKAECSKLKKIEFRKKDSIRRPKRFKKKAMAATWDYSSDSDNESSSSNKEEEEANLALMANLEDKASVVWTCGVCSLGGLIGDSLVDANLCDLQNIGLPESSSLTPFSLSLALTSFLLLPHYFQELYKDNWRNMECETVTNRPRKCRTVVQLPLGGLIGDSLVDANLCDLQNIGLPESSSLTPFSLSLALTSCLLLPHYFQELYKDNWRNVERQTVMVSMRGFRAEDTCEVGLGFLVSDSVGGYGAAFLTAEQQERYTTVKIKVCGNKAVDIADLQKNRMGSIIAAMERMKLTKLATLSEVSYPNLVKAFYVCLKTEEDGSLTSTVKGTQIKITYELLETLFGVCTTGHSGVHTVDIQAKGLGIVGPEYKLKDGKIDINQLNAFNRILHFIVCQILVPRSATYSTCTKADSDLMLWAIQNQDINMAEVEPEILVDLAAEVVAYSHSTDVVMEDASIQREQEEEDIPVDTHMEDAPIQGEQSIEKEAPIQGEHTVGVPVDDQFREGIVESASDDENDDHVEPVARASSKGKEVAQDIPLLTRKPHRRASQLIQLEPWVLNSKV
ncbi:hypothetical protein Taro_009352 [Colocasia esculenta]|uniref:Uncharacterized protein n=1 Tax=Colocasia esculenta TaxID=4460 RepID=A0A843U046_COLES|nr:hypothetical protein [Colocasia esculenta]